MDQGITRDHIKRHADAVARGDMDALTADFSEELRPQVPQTAQALPQPVTAAEVLSVEVGEPETVAMIAYSGDASEVSIGSRWQNQGGRPVIVAARARRVVRLVGEETPRGRRGRCSRRAKRGYARSARRSRSAAPTAAPSASRSRP
jgi:hypothetical protein